VTGRRDEFRHGKEPWSVRECGSGTVFIAGLTSDLLLDFIKTSEFSSLKNRKYYPLLLLNLISCWKNLTRWVKLK
jgi:hypothetical protein